MRQLKKPPVMVPPESHTANLDLAKYCLCFDSVFLRYRHTRRNKGRQILDKKKKKKKKSCPIRQDDHSRPALLVDPKTPFPPSAKA